MIRFRDGNIVLSEDLYDNFVPINNEEYLLSYLNPNQPFNKGANSNVFIVSDPEGESEDIIIKICKAPYYPRSKDKRIKRFQREVRAFKIAKQNKITGVIEYYNSGTIHIDGFDFLYILMEKASDDLASYLEKQKFDFTLNQKVSFCINLINSFRKLHEVGIYHRDIKHDNILVVNDELKIGDLGLVSFQDEDYGMDRDNEKIGPAGWLSPEATNKMLTYRKRIGNTYDCIINHQSDVFQIGKLFWYIFQGNLPTGQIIQADKRFEEDDIFNIIFAMVQYDKARRPTISEISNLIEPIRKRLFV